MYLGKVGKIFCSVNVNIDTTVQEKNITFPTDAKLNTFSLVLEN